MLPAVLSRIEMDEVANEGLCGWGSSRMSVSNDGVGINRAVDDGFADDGAVDDGAAVNRRRWRQPQRTMGVEEDGIADDGVAGNGVSGDLASDLWL